MHFERQPPPTDDVLRRPMEVQLQKPVRPSAVGEARTLAQRLRETYLIMFCIVPLKMSRNLILTLILFARTHFMLIQEALLASFLVRLA